MSQVAPGWIRSANSGTRFIATFTINDLQYNFTGNLSPSVQDFMSTEATVTYSTVGQLTTTRGFDGQVGRANIVINLVNGPVIAGPLDMPINPASTVSGHGTWNQN